MAHIPAAPQADEAPKQPVHPRARRISVSKAQPPADVQHPSLTYNTNHVFEINQATGQASVCVNDTLEMRAAFLKYCNSSMRPTEMHRMAGPFMTAPNFMSMCKDMELSEPQGPLSPMVIGICYATLKSDDAEGLTYAAFLDALMELAFEAGRNVAGQLQAIYAAKPQPVPRPPGLTRSDSNTRVRVSEPGFAPQAPLQPRLSEAGTMPLPSSPVMERTLQPRFSENGRFQRSSSMFRSLPSPLDTSSSILSSSNSAISPKAALEEELRSSSANGVSGEGPKCPRPPSSLIRTSLSGAAPSRPAFRPSIGQRALKARGLGLPPAPDFVGDGDHGGEVPAHHPLHSFFMNSSPTAGGGGGGAGAGPEPPAAATPAAPAAAAASPVRSSLSRISAKFQIQDAAGDDSDNDSDALFPSPRVQTASSTTTRASITGPGRPPSASSSASRQSINGRPTSSLLSRTSVSAGQP